ncbi:MAG: ABC transporter ATP-binding protein [Anaerolineae bacterium]|nr:ABC transporter ATP-binding protein [Anaerolineae bacterium]
MGQLQVIDVIKHLGGNLIVNQVSFTVEEGEFFVLLGPSGSGKSTLLRLICGLEEIESGQIIVDGRDVSRVPPRERNLGMVFQDYGLYPNMNVYQNIAYGLEARGEKRAVIEERVPAAADRLGLSELLQFNVVDLSGGEQQRVALARAMVKDADAYLYDEPLSNLDPKLRHKARRDIMFVHREKRKPSVYVTHDQAEAFAMGDRIAVMGDGRLQQIGSTEDLIHNPASVFVAGFVGSPPINLIEGDIVTQNDRLHFTRERINLALPDKWKSPLGSYGSQRVVLGIRPDAFAKPGLSDEFEITFDNTIDGKVDFIEPLLGEAVVGLRVSDRINISATLDDSLAEQLIEGESMALGVNPDRILLFDIQTQQAIKPE